MEKSKQKAVNGFGGGVHHGPVSSRQNYNKNNYIREYAPSDALMKKFHKVGDINELDDFHVYRCDKQFIVSLTDFYRQRANQKEYKLNPDEISVGHHYVCCEEVELKVDIWVKHYYRIKIVEPASQGSPSASHKKYVAWLLDQGRKVVVDGNNVFKLAPKFKNNPCLSFKAALADVSYNDNQLDREVMADIFAQKVGKNGVNDPPELLISFLIRGKRVLRPPTTNGYSIVYYIVPIPIPKGAPLNDSVTQRETTVAAVLINEYTLMLTATGMGAGHRHLAYLTRAPNEYPTVPVSWVQKRTLKDDDPEADLNTWPRSMTNFKFSTLYSGPPSVVETPLVKWQSCFAWISPQEIDIALGPAAMYIHMRIDSFKLNCMNEKLGEIVNTQPPLTKDGILPGIIVASKVRDENDVPFWTRSVVVCHCNDEEDYKIKVILIDYGKVTLANLNDFRKLPPQFKKISSFCQRIHLDCSRSVDPRVKQVPLPEEGQPWSSVDKEKFAKYISSFITTEPVYYAWTPRWGDLGDLAQLTQ